MRLAQTFFGLRVARAASPVCTSLLAIAACLLPEISSGTLLAPPATKVCPDGDRILATATCEALPGTTNSGLSGSTLSGVGVDISNNIGGVTGGALGEGAGGTASSGAARTALSGQTGQAAAAGANRWNAWAALSRVNVGYSFQPLQSSGNSDLTLGGIDYTISNSIVLGAALSGERTRIDTSYNGGRISGDGTSFLPYLGWRINNAWMFDATLGAGTTNLTTTDNSIAGGITGSNKARRSVGTLGITYGQAMGRWVLTGKGSLLSVENKYSSFTFSNGQFVDAVTTRTSQLRLGGQAAYNAGMFVPFVGLVYINDIQRPNQAPIAGQSAANDRDGWQVRAGVNFRSNGALYGGIVLSSEVGRSQVKNDQLLVNIGVRF